MGHILFLMSQNKLGSGPLTASCQEPNKVQFHQGYLSFSVYVCVCICVSVHVCWRSASAVTCGNTIPVTAVINSPPSQGGGGTPSALRQDGGLGHGGLRRYRSPSPPSGSTHLTSYLPLQHDFLFFSYISQSVTAPLARTNMRATAAVCSDWQGFKRNLFHCLFNRRAVM